MADFYTLLTNAGIAYENACKAAGLPIKLSQISVGDGNGAVYNPDATATALKREVWRGPLNALFQDVKNPSWLVAEVTIPPEVGGFYVREAGIWTDTGILYAVVKYPESFKPVLATSGSGKEFYIRAIFETSNASQVTLLIDDTIVRATRAWVIDYVAGELAKLDGKQSVRVAATANIVLSGPQQVDGVAVVAGDRVLAPKQAAAKDNGIWVAANGAWVRAADADNSLEVTPGLFVSVEMGTLNGDSVWQLVTDAPIVLGTTALTFEMVAGRTGVVAGSYASVTVDKLGRIIAGTNPNTLAGHGITDGLRVGVVSSQRPILAGNLPAKDDNNADGAGGAISIREVGEVGDAQSAIEYAPGIHFHWFNRFARYLKMSVAGDLIWGAWKLWHEGNFNPALKANLASPALTGTPTGPTAVVGTSTTQLATTAFTYSAVNAYATTVTASLALKADVATALKVGSVSRQRPVLSGPTPAGADSGADGAGGAIEIREINEVGNAQTDMKWAPSILFNWSAKFARYLKMSSVGDLVWGDKKIFTEGNITDVLATVALQPNGRILIPTKDGSTLYFQWYEGPISGAEGVAYPVVSHPVPFPNQCLFAGVFTRSTTDNTLSDQMFQMSTWDRLGVKVFPQWFGTGNQSLVKPLIIAIGN